MKNCIAMLCLFVGFTSVNAKPVVPNTNFSGIYDCKVSDHQEGALTGVVTLELVKEQSIKQYSAYNFKLEVPGFGEYLGHAAANGNNNSMAIYFAHTDTSARDYGTGIASFKRNHLGKWEFSKYYYEPEFKGGNYGMEECVQR